MFRHIVLVRWKASAGEEQRKAMYAAIEGLPQRVPDIRHACIGLNVGQGPNHYDMATVFDFDDRDAFKRYLQSDAHQAYVQGPAQAVDQLAVVQHFF